MGKATSIIKRLKQHFLFSVTSDEWISTTFSKVDGGIAKRNTSSQVRAGIEHLYLNDKLAKNLNDKLANIGISSIIDINFKERFYLEDLAIGYYRPWFNLDSER